MKREDFEALLSTELDSAEAEAEALAMERTRSAFLTRFGTASGVVATIDAILADEVWLAEVAHDSCRHALGFDKLVLLKCGDAGQLRLHVWWTAGRRADEHIHGHRFLFESVLVTGRLSTELFAEDPAGLRCDAYRESSTEAARRWTFEPDGKRSVTRVATLELVTGSRYVLTPEILHRAVVPTNVLTMTLLLQTRLTRHWSPVLVPEGEAPPTSAPQRAFEPSAAAAILSRIRSRLLAIGPAGPDGAAARV
jgi:hypothetical protein